MKWLRTIVIFDKGGIVSTPDWQAIHESYTRSIASIDYPSGTGLLTLREKEAYYTGTGENRKKKWRRNGVGYLKKRFLAHLVNVEKWKPESKVAIEKAAEDEPKRFTLYPSGDAHEEEGGSFGSFDFLTSTAGGHKVAIEWETGNISSSHRSLNKLCICLEKGLISAGVLIIPSRALYAHLTDRIGNVTELTPYLMFWKRVSETIDRGFLAVSVVEHDALTTDPSVKYLKVGADGNSERGKD